eukprot:COSAG06_NODE_38039_length_428_cov_0.726444_1_plen_139_part_10
MQHEGQEYSAWGHAEQLEARLSALEKRLSAVEAAQQGSKSGSSDSSGDGQARSSPSDACQTQSTGHTETKPGALTHSKAVAEPSSPTTLPCTDASSLLNSGSSAGSGVSPAAAADDICAAGDTTSEDTQQMQQEPQTQQ